MEQNQRAGPLVSLTLATSPARVLIGITRFDIQAPSTRPVFESVPGLMIVSDRLRHHERRPRGSKPDWHLKLFREQRDFVRSGGMRRLGLQTSTTAAAAPATSPNSASGVAIGNASEITFSNRPAQQVIYSVSCSTPYSCVPACHA
jgi:hypothetical protein